MVGSALLSLLLVGLGPGPGLPDDRGDDGPPAPQAGGEGVPPVLVVMADDIGWELFRQARTPNLDQLAARGTTFTRFWATPKCGPTRASLLTGRFHFRIGDGNGEAARQHRNRSLGLEEPYLPRTLGTEGTAAFGKWHLSSSDPLHPNRAGFEHFAGTLGNLNGSAYDSWPRIENGEEENCTGYATTVTTDDALASDAWFKYVAYHAAHTPFHDPPAELAPGTELDGTPEVQVLAMVEALDTELGRLFAAHEDGYVFFLTDNGTTGLVDGGKGTLQDEGIAVPLIVRGPGVREGVESDALVNVVDLYATICELRGIEPPAEAEDSVSFAGALRGEPGNRAWNYTCLFREKTPNRRTEAVRTTDYKLIFSGDLIRINRPEPSGARRLFRMPGEVLIPFGEWSEEDRAAQAVLDEIRLSLRLELDR